MALKQVLSKSSGVLAIELCLRSVSILEMSLNRGEYVIEQLFCDRLPAEMMFDDSINSVHGLGKYLQMLLKKYQFKAKKACIAIPNHLVIRRVFSISQEFSEAEIEKFLQLELGKMNLFPTPSIQFDFKILGPSLDNPWMKEVLVIVCPLNVVRDRIQALHLAGLQMMAVDVESYAIARLIEWMQKDKILRENEFYTKKFIAFIYVSERIVQFLVLQGLRILYTNEGSCLSAGNGQLQIMSLEEQFKHAINDFSLKYPHEAIQALILGGHPEYCSTLHAMINEHIGVPITEADPFANFVIHSRLDLNSMKQISSRSMVSCGLALRAW